MLLMMCVVTLPLSGKEPVCQISDSILLCYLYFLLSIRLSILTTTSDGSVVCYTGSKEETDKEPSTGTYHLIETARWKAHGFEAWYGVFDIQQTSKIYSGMLYSHAVLSKNVSS